MTTRPLPDRPTVVAARALVVRRGHQVALGIDDLELSGGTIALVGPNGSGKSTLLHTIAGLLKPTAGTVEVLGGTPQAARRRVAYVLQSQHGPSHLPVTAREAVSLGRAPTVGAFGRLKAVDRARVDEAMELLEIGDLANRQLAEMSGGQRQRVMVAQGLAQDAELVLLDEPVAGVDLASMATIRRAVNRVAADGRAVIVSTHDLGDAANYDQVVLLAKRVVSAGTAAEALTTDHLRAAYAGRILDLDGSDIAIDDGSHH